MATIGIVLDKANFVVSKKIFLTNTKFCWAKRRKCRLCQVASKTVWFRAWNTLIVNKVITTMVIMPLDDPKWCAQYVVDDLQPLGLGYVWGQGWAQSIAHPWVHISSLLTHMIYPLPFWSYLAGHPHSQPSDDKYCSRSYRFIERQKRFDLSNFRKQKNNPKLDLCHLLNRRPCAFCHVRKKSNKRGQCGPIGSDCRHPIARLISAPWRHL